MRTALTAAALVLLTACSSTPPSTAPTVESEVINTGPTPTTTSSAPKILAWGGKGNSSGVDLQLDAPQPDPTPTSDGRYVIVPTTVTNTASGSARLSFSGRVGQQEAAWTAGDDVGEFLPGEQGTMRARFLVPAGVSGELVVEVYANIDGAPTTNRLTFKGPLPPAA